MVNKKIFFFFIGMIIILGVSGCKNQEVSDNNYVITYAAKKEDIKKALKGELKVQSSSSKKQTGNFKYNTGTFKIVGNNAFTEEKSIMRNKDYSEPDERRTRTEKFVIYIYQINTNEFSRKVDINKIFKDKNKNYNPVSLLGFSLVDGKLCYDIFVMDSENSTSFKVGLDIKNDKIVKVFKDDKEWEHAEKRFEDEYIH